MRAILVALLALCLAAPAADARSALRTIEVRAPNEMLTLEVADTYQSREHGLMFRTAVPHKTGMIFVFAADGPLPFWMKNTLVPLDMIFVRSDGTITSIAADVPASTAETPDDMVAQRAGSGKYVIELAAGEAARLGLRAGLRLKVPKLVPRD